jgi:hypothetical protein
VHQFNSNDLMGIDSHLTAILLNIPDLDFPDHRTCTFRHLLGVCAKPHWDGNVFWITLGWCNVGGNVRATHEGCNAIQLLQVDLASFNGTRSIQHFDAMRSDCRQKVARPINISHHCIHSAIKHHLRSTHANTRETEEYADLQAHKETDALARG